MIKTKGNKVCIYDGDKEIKSFMFGKGEEYETEEDAMKAAKAAKSKLNKEVKEADVSEAESTDNRVIRIRNGFRKMFRPEAGRGEDRTPFQDLPYCEHVYDSEGYVVARKGSDSYRVNYIVNGDGEVNFDDITNWRRVEMQPVLVESDEGSKESYSIFGEHWGTEVDMFEEAGTDELAEALQFADIALGEPGFGNKRDNHYYSRDFWKDNAHKFNGAKMYSTDHKEGEHNVRNWVANIVEVGKRFLPTGAPVARIAVHKKDFWEQLQSLKEHGLLDTMHTSILATGTSKKGKVNGTDAKIVEAVNEVKSVDFVSRAGAGGRVLALAESLAEGGDIDLLTFDLLVERRPDIVERIRQEEKSKVFGSKDEYQAEKTKLLSEANDMSKTVEELQAEISVVEQKLAEAQALLEEASTGKLKDEAIKHLSEKYDNLPEAIYNRIVDTIQEGEFVEDADVPSVVDGLVEAEIAYAKSLMPGGNIIGMGEAYVEDTEEEEVVEERSYEDRTKATDSVLAEYGIIPNKESK